MYGFGSSKFNISDYAPIDPMSDIPGFGLPIQQPLGATPSAVPQQPANPSTSTQSAPVHRSQSTSQQQPGARSVRTETQRRHVSTEEMRSDFNRAPKYIPTPINEDGVEQGKSTTSAASSKSTHPQTQKNPACRQQPNNASSASARPSGSAPNVALPQHPPQPPFVGQPQTMQCPPRISQVPQHMQGPPPGYMPPQRIPLPPTADQLKHQEEQARIIVFDMVTKLTPEEIKKMPTFIDYVENNPSCVRFKGVVVDASFIVSIFESQRVPISNNLRMRLPSDHSLYIDPSRQQGLPPVQQQTGPGLRMLPPGPLHQLQQMQGGICLPPGLMSPFHPALMPAHVFSPNHQLRPGMGPPMPPNQMRHNGPSQGPQVPPNMIQRQDAQYQQNQPVAHQFAPPPPPPIGHMNGDNFMHSAQMQQEQFRMDPRATSRFPVRVVDRNQMIPQQQQQQRAPPNMQQPMHFDGRQPQPYPHQNAPPVYAQLRPMQQQEPPQQANQGVSSSFTNSNVYPVVSADQEPPPSALTPLPTRASPTEDDAKPVVHRTVPATVPTTEKAVVPDSAKPLVPETFPKPQRKPQKKAQKRPIEVITIEDDVPRPRIKQEAPDEEVSSSSTVLVSSSVKREPSTSAANTLSPKDIPKYTERDFEQIKKKYEDIERDTRKRLEGMEKKVERLMEHAGQIEKVAVQEQQVTTSLDEVTKTRKSRSPSSESASVRPKRRKRIVESDDDDEETRDPVRVHPAKKVSDDRLSTSTEPHRRKAKSALPEDSDDEMPIVKRKRRGPIDSDDDDDYEEEKSPVVSEDSEGSGSTTSTDDEDSIRKFVVSDDSDDSDSADDLPRRGRKSSEKRTTRREQSRNRKSSSKMSENREKIKSESPKIKETEHKERTKKAQPENKKTPATGPPRELTEEAKEAVRRLRNMKTRKTREENREKKHKARLDLMEQTPIRTTRSTRGTSVAKPQSPISEALQDTIAKFQETAKSEQRSSSSKKESPKTNRPSEKKREEATPSNKRPSVQDSRGDNDGVHIPAKRMAHSNSVPGPSRARPTPPTSKKRPNQYEMMSQRDKEAAEKRKRDEAERDRLKKKPYLTNEETSELRALEKRLGQNPIKSAGPSTPSSSTSARRVTVKQEPKDPIPEKKRPPPKFLDSSKGIKFLSLRRDSIGRIFNCLVDMNGENPDVEAQNIELQLVTAHPVENKYRMAVTHKILNIKKSNPSGILEVNKNAVSHDRILAGGAKENCTVAKPKKNFDYRQLSLEDLHPHLVRFKLTLAELERNAYPLFKSSNKVVEIAETTYTANKKMFLEDYDNKRSCSRCLKEFRLNDNGTMIREKDICRYHNRAIIRDGKKQTFSKRWQCCNEEVSTNTPGCKFSDIHVFDQLFRAELGRFVPTPAPSSPTDSRSTNAFALDCEMVYTMRGPALARLTMVDMKGNQVLDVFIKPPSEVIDANTEFSGLTKEQVDSSKDTLETCHKKLFKYVNSETILIGHSLESDLKAMRIVHTSVIDTAIMFSGTDHKKALKKLSSLYLGKSIQGDNEDAVGHDSLEDAMTCVNLIFHGLKNPETVPLRTSL